MKKILIAATFLASLGANAQEYKVAKSSGKLDFSEVNSVRIEGYAGNEIIFTSRSGRSERDERAQGLRAVSNMGLEDNTGLGLSVLDKNGVIEVRQLKKMDGPDITVKVPKGVTVYYSHTSPHGSDLFVRNLESELKVSTVHNDVILDNVTGPLEIKTVHGDIDATFPNGLKTGIQLSSVHGHVDVALPLATKADLRLSTSWGEIFVDPDFKFEFDQAGSMVKYSDKLRGKINGGGLEVSLSSSHDNVYLRKK